MTNPQDPQQPHGDSPQDPGNPQNPYGEGPPSSPAGQPAPPPQYGQPPPAQPSYGQPQYGAPQPGQPQYGTPQPFPGGPATDQPSKGMAIASLVLSLIGCTIIAGIVSIVLAVIVLRRGKDGRDHGKGFAIAGLIISVLSILLTVVLVVLGVVAGSTLKDVNDLKTGDCVNINGLNDEEFESLETVECAKEHDAEVLATVKLSEDQAADYDETGGSDLCSAAVPAEEQPTGENLEFLFLTDLGEPKAGDTLACLVRATDGKLTGRV